MALDFPASPITGQTYTGPGGIIWAWDGVKWVNGTQIGTAYAPIASPLFTGDPRSTTTPPPGDADTSLATTAFVAAAVAPTANNAGRNFIHNPIFTVAQRGVGGWTTNNSYTLDRWLLGLSGDTVTVSQFTISDAGRAGIGNELAVFGLNNSFTGTSGAASYNVISQAVENVYRLSGKTVTASFWGVAAAGTPKVGISFDQGFGTGGSPSPYVPGNGQPVTLSTTWQRYSVTFALPSVAGKTMGTNGDSRTWLNIWYSSGATNNTFAGNIGVQSGNITLWGVQLEVGSVATPLDYGGSPQQQLAQCQRFYQGMLNVAGGGYATAGVVVQQWYPFIVAMRAAPTLTANWGTNTNLTPSVSVSGNGFYVSGSATGTGQWGFNLNVLAASADL